MLASYTKEQLKNAGRYDLSDDLERGNIVHFPHCPIELPSQDDIIFLRDELPAQMKLKNISYHPEADTVRGIDADGELQQRARRILVEHSDRIESFLNKIIPSLTPNWTIGTSSFRPMQEKGRDLKPHASNELIHVDAGAYGATNGDRIFRFFVNVNPDEDRVWATKGTFPDLYRKYGEQAGIRVDSPSPGYLEKGPLDHMRTGVIRGLGSLGLPLTKVLDSSPYDRTMRKFHNFMKDTPEFQQSPDGHQEIRFAPFSAWMVFTDMVSHASLSGRFAFIHTSIIPLENCRHPELAPINILKAAA